MTASVASAPSVPMIGRPTRLLPLSQLLNLSFYWLGLTAIWAGLDATVLPKRMDQLLGTTNAPLGLAVVVTAGVVMPIVVQPTMGMISDYTTSRWGRRKPYIAIGAVLDMAILLAMAASNEFLALLLFYVLLQFSSNLAQGPFQGYMPDLVPESQVGRASGLMGLMIVVGQVAGRVRRVAGSVGDGRRSTRERGDVLAHRRSGHHRADDRRRAAASGSTGVRWASTVTGEPWRRVAGAAWGRDVLAEPLVRVAGRVATVLPGRHRLGRAVRALVPDAVTGAG